MAIHKCPKCGGFRIDDANMPISQIEECMAYHIKHSAYCDPEVARRTYGTD